MSVARVHHNKNYTCMSNYHFQDKTLSLKAKGLLSLMLSLPDTWDYSVAGLATLSSDGETSVRTAVKELEEHSYLHRTPVRECGRIIDWEYDIYEQPKEILDVENQQVENLALDSEYNKVRKQTNTKKVNTSNSKELLQNSDFQFGKTKPKKDNLYTKCVTLVDDFISKHNCGNVVRSKLIDYLNYRMSVKDKPLYTNIWKGMLNKLDALHKEGYGYEPVIDFSLERGYLSFYPPSNFSKNRGIQSESGARHVPRMTEEDYEEEERRLAELEAKGVQVRF